MNSTSPLMSALIERFFVERLMNQRRVSPHTIASYRDTFRLLFRFAELRLHKQPSSLSLGDIDAPMVSAFLDDLEKRRSVTARTRNLRLTAIRSFFHFAAYEEPAHSAHIQRVLAIPAKRHTRALIPFLTRPEIEALIAAPDKSTWIGRRDHALLLFAVQTGLRLSELASINREAITLGKGAHVRCVGKGRKERCTPLTRHCTATLRAWLEELPAQDSQPLFPSSHGERLSPDAIQYLLNKHAAAARLRCPSLRQKRISPHVLRHTAAMELLSAGVDTSVIALWLGHESVETTQVYLEANLALKEAALAKVAPTRRTSSTRYRPPDQLLAFLRAL